MLEAHIEAGGSRFKGIRQSAGWDPAVILTTATPATRGCCWTRRSAPGSAGCTGSGLTYECSFYHPQLPEVIDLARAFPDQPICANHCGGPICIGPYREHPQETFAAWQRDLRELRAARTWC